MKEILERLGYDFVYRQGEYTIYKNGVKIPNVSYRTIDQAENYCCRLIVRKLDPRISPLAQPESIVTRGNCQEARF